MRLALNRAPAYDHDPFIVSDCNRDAVTAVDAWPQWPGGCLALIGPEGSGKTHLARAWASRAGAFIANGPPPDLGVLPVGPVLVEDADRRGGDLALFHLINRADAGASLLLTAREAPRRWVTALPDLPSRLNALRAVELGAPDDLVLEGLLMKFFRDRNIRPERDVLAYLLRRMERSAPAAQAVVRELDERADASGRGITRALAREILEAGNKTRDLFE